MSNIRYIGSKSRILTEIFGIIGDINNRLFVDVFAGSGAVTKRAARLGWKIHSNDYLHSASVLNKANLFSAKEISFINLGGYVKTIDILNNLSPVEGYFFKEYSPSGESQSGHVRKYFTCENAKKIDAIRIQIDTWNKHNVISDYETSLLLADLIISLDTIANTSGTYGCFLKTIEKSAHSPLFLSPRELQKNPIHFTVTNYNFLDIDNIEKNTVAYIDPPYSKRQYAAYYHILETLVLYDSPIVGGVTGLRSWQDKASPFCYKKHAPQAFRDLMDTIKSNNIYISYSDEGQIAIDDLYKILQEFGKTKIHKIGSIGRYSPNKKVSKKRNNVNEYLFEIRR